jgi:hypothetical protein
LVSLLLSAEDLSVFLHVECTHVTLDLLHSGVFLDQTSLIVYG